jgi:hypothetical protein
VTHSGPWLTESGADRRRGDTSPAHGMPDTTGPRSLPAVTRDEKGDEAELVRGSPELERQRRGGAREAKNGGGMSST